MNNPLQDVLYVVGEKIIAYLPNLVAGIVLTIIGWFLGWLVKRIVVQMLMVLRVDRLLRRFQWGTGLSRGDIRYGFYESIGNVAFFIVFLILLNASFDALQLTVLSHVLERAVLFIPKLLVAIVIFSVGWLFAGWIAGAIQKTLQVDEIPRAALIAHFAKAVTILFFAAMALTELDIAREIVIIGFSATIITLGVLAIVLTAIGGKNFVRKVVESLED